MNKFNILNTQYSEDIVCNLTMEEDLKDKFIEDFETKKINLKEIKILDKKIIDKSIWFFVFYKIKWKKFTIFLNSLELESIMQL